jgi:hypothetical protein
MWNSVISTKNAQYVTTDLKLFYLTAPMDNYEYMPMPLKIIPEHIIEQYNLYGKKLRMVMSIWKSNVQCTVFPKLASFYCPSKKYGKDTQLPLPINESPRLGIQQIVGAILYYA